MKNPQDLKTVKFYETYIFCKIVSIYITPKNKSPPSFRETNEYIIVLIFL